MDSIQVEYGWQVPAPPLVDQLRMKLAEFGVPQSGDMDVKSAYPVKTQCICPVYDVPGYGTQYVAHPECFVHGDKNVLNQPYGRNAMLPAVIGADNRSAGVRQEEWLRKYVAENGVVIIATWQERPNQVVSKEYALYVNGTNKADLIGQRIGGLIALRDFLNHVIDSEEPKTVESD